MSPRHRTGLLFASVGLFFLIVGVPGMAMFNLGGAFAVLAKWSWVRE